VWGSKRMEDDYRHPSEVVRVSKDELIVHIHCATQVNLNAINERSCQPIEL